MDQPCQGTPASPVVAVPPPIRAGSPRGGAFKKGLEWTTSLLTKPRWSRIMRVAHIRMGPSAFCLPLATEVECGDHSRQAVSWSGYHSEAHTA